MRRQLWRSVKGTKKDAERLLVELLHERDTGAEQPTGRQTVAQYLERWLTAYAESSLAPSTLAHYRRTVRKVLIPALDSIELTALRPNHVQALCGRLLRTGRANGGALAPRSVGIYHQVLHKALADAVRWQMLARNPADAVQRPSVPRRQLLALAPGQVLALLAAADETPVGGWPAWRS